MTIQFNQIPATVGVPGSYGEFDPSGARTTAGGKQYRALVFAPMSAPKTLANPNGSTVPANMPRLVGSAAQVATMFGTGSIAHHMANTYFNTNSQTETWFVGQLDDAAGVARVVTADYSTAYTAAATVQGVERVYIGEAEYLVPVAIGDTAAVIATALAAAITADTTALFAATVAGAVLTLTAKVKGELLNDTQIVAQYYDTDLSASGTFVAFTQATAGAANPSIAASIASVASVDFTHAIVPYNDAGNAALILTEAQNRWGALPMLNSTGQGQNDFIIFGAYRGSEAQVEAFMQTRNTEYRTTLHVEPTQTIGGIQYAGLLSGAWQAAAHYGATSAKLVATVANKPHQNEIMPNLKGAPRVTRSSWNLRNRAILSYGMATYKYNPDGQVVLEAGITEKTLNENGAPYDGERRVETQFAKSYMRSSLNAMLTTRFSNYRLADNGTRGLPNDVATPNMIGLAIVSLAKQDWVAKGIIEDLEGFTKSLIVERSASDCNTINIQMFPDIVNVLSVFGVKFSYKVC